MNVFPRLDALHYLIITREDRVVAHCLDLDLVAVGKDRATAEYRLNAAVSVQIATAYATGNYEGLFFHAPAEYWQQMSQAEALPLTTLTLETSPPMVLPVERKIKVQLPVFRAVTVAR